MSLTAGYTFTDGEVTSMAKKLNLAVSSASAYNGTVGATTPNTGAFTTISSTGRVTFDLGASAGTLPAAIAASVVVQLGNADAVASALQADAFGSGNGLIFMGRTTGGTRAAQSATPSGKSFVTLQAFGFDTALTTAASGSYAMISDGAWGAGNKGVLHRWNGTPNGSTTAATWMTLDGTGLNVAVGPVVHKTYTVANLPAAASFQGAIAFVSDATQTATAGIGAVVAGTGANIVPVFSDGTNWRII